jgi:hypothetical protein
MWNMNKKLNAAIIIATYRERTGLVALNTCPTYRGMVVAAANAIDVWTYSFNHTLSCS